MLHLFRLRGLFNLSFEHRLGHWLLLWLRIDASRFDRVQSDVEYGRAAETLKQLRENRVIRSRLLRLR